MSNVVHSAYHRRVKKNKRIKKLFALLETGVYAIDTDALLVEIDQIHSTRYFRAYTVKEVLQSAQKKIVRATMQNSAYRSRLIAIRMRCFKASRLLEEHITSATDYIASKFNTELKNEYTTVKARDQAIANTLRPFLNLKFRLQTVMAMVDMVIADTDQTYWSIKLTSDAVQLAFQRERNI